MGGAVGERDSCSTHLNRISRGAVVCRSQHSNLHKVNIHNTVLKNNEPTRHCKDHENCSVSLSVNSLPLFYKRPVLKFDHEGFPLETNPEKSFSQNGTTSTTQRVLGTLVLGSIHQSVYTTTTQPHTWARINLFKLYTAYQNPFSVTGIVVLSYRGFQGVGFQLTCGGGTYSSVLLLSPLASLHNRLQVQGEGMFK